MLPPETDKVWNFLKEQPALAGFVLIGGSALALRIQHRRSEDLDLTCSDLRLHGFSIRDYQGAFREVGAEQQCAIGLGRLCSGVPQKDDEGYAHLLSQPPTLAAMKNFFVAQRDKLEVETAADAMHRHRSEDGQRPAG